LAELEAIQILTFKDANVTFSFSSFYELCKCAVEHASADASANAFGYKSYKSYNHIVNANANVSPLVSPFVPPFVPPCLCSILTMMFSNLEVFFYEPDKCVFFAAGSSLFLDRPNVFACAVVHKCAVKHANANANAKAFQILEVFFYEPDKCAVFAASFSLFFDRANDLNLSAQIHDYFEHHSYSCVSPNCDNFSENNEVFQGSSFKVIKASKVT
jgi:hypothetical protein